MPPFVPSDPRTPLAARLRALRDWHGYAAREVADKVGVKVGSISKWEIGVSAPWLNNLVALADLYGVSVDWLVGREVDARLFEANVDEYRRQRGWLVD